MKYYNFNTIYVNGSSLTAGGGLDQDIIKNEYKKLYNVEWGNEKDITYPKYIANHFNVTLTHDAFSGSGAPRLVRRTYEHIEKIGMDKVRNTLFLFEITSPVHRVDQYYNEIGDYVITNVRYDDDKNVGALTGIQIHDVITKDKIKYSQKYFEGRITNETKEYLTKYHNPVAYVDKYRGEMVG